MGALNDFMLNVHVYSIMGKTTISSTFDIEINLGSRKKEDAYLTRENGSCLARL